MTEATNVMLGITIVLSLLAAASWMRVSHSRKMQRLDGRRTSEADETEAAYKLVILTVVATGLAATFGAIDWFSAT